ncbi:MAG TPA: hypothetical protein VI540_04410 [Gaiellaceae bacterium]|nr:hypothetical protein [Gaiellaceae bacterium]
MSIFTKRNAAIGYLTLKALERRRKRRSGAKLGLYIALGLVSFGILAGVAAVVVRRSGTSVADADDAAADAESDEADDEIVGEYVMTATEPIPAT